VLVSGRATARPLPRAPPVTPSAARGLAATLKQPQHITPMRRFYVYILTNHSRTLYVGITNDLARRLAQHAEGSGSSFTSKYHINRLVYYEEFQRARDAIEREKQVKGYRRDKKLALIEAMNPHWEDLGAGV
jgi:putative endonuclease